MTQKMGLMPFFSKNEISLLRPAINEWRPKKLHSTYPKIKYTPQNLNVSEIVYPNLATVVQLSLFLVLQYTTSSLNFLANFDPYYSSRSLEVLTLYWIQGQ